MEDLRVKRQRNKEEIRWYDKSLEWYMIERGEIWLIKSLFRVRLIISTLFSKNYTINWIIGMECMDYYLWYFPDPDYGYSLKFRNIF